VSWQRDQDAEQAVGEELVDLAMAGYRHRLASGAIHIDRVPAAFTEELAAVLLQMADQIIRFTPSA
jgi:hypothetical protein